MKDKFIMYTVYLTLNNGEKSEYISSMSEKNKELAIKKAIANDWLSGVKSIDRVEFENL